jgi:hypothetical protein
MKYTGAFEAIRSYASPEPLEMVDDFDDQNVFGFETSWTLESTVGSSSIT